MTPAVPPTPSWCRFERHHGWLGEQCRTQLSPGRPAVPGARYCADATCPAGDTGGGSTGRVDPAGNTTEGWQGLLGQNSFIEFGMKPFGEGENGGIKGHVIYASTRPFDDPQLLLQLSWAPGVPRVKVNLYEELPAPDGVTSTLRLVDTTTTSSWDDWAQGFRSTTTTGGVTSGTPNMNCPARIRPAHSSRPCRAARSGSTRCAIAEQRPVQVALTAGRC